MIGIIILVTLIVLISIYVLNLYNKLIKKENAVKKAASGIEVYLTERFALIPNLVQCVKSYKGFEQELIIDITSKREEYLRNKDIKIGEALNNECNKVLALAENYPDLKTSDQFLELQRNLSKLESQLQAARRIYNSEVNNYNNTVQIFPNNIFSKMLNFKEKELFQAEEEAKNKIDLDL